MAISSEQINDWNRSFKFNIALLRIPSSWEADQSAVYKRSGGAELVASEEQISLASGQGGT